MLVLFETPAGYAIFKLLDEKKLKNVDDLYKEFESPDSASKVVKLKHFHKFDDTTEALAATTAAVEGKMGKGLKKLLKKVVAKDAHEQLAVSDAKLAGAIKDKMSINCISSSAIQELMRGIRNQMNNLVTGIQDKEMAAMALGLAHSLSRYKLKFSPDKVDTMIVQAISLLDDLDKELNNYVMRCREWFGWHFPELTKIVTDNIAYAKTVKAMGTRANVADLDFSEILPEEVEEQLKAAAEISMGVEISKEDEENIMFLCDQILEIADYRAQLYDYLKNRMIAIAPNLTALVGELVGARLIAHAGSLINLAKHPSSTVQILGAEKALFRALKTKHDTPKYGLIYHASLVGQTAPKNKGKISRMLAAKASLAIRVDALGEDSNAEMGVENRAKLEARLKMFEEGQMRKLSGTGKSQAKFDKYENKSQIKTYNPDADSTIGKAKKRKHEETEEEGKKEVAKEAKKEEKEPEEEEEEEEEEVPTKKSKKEKKKKKEKRKTEAEESEEEEETAAPKDESSEKKKKKKKKKKQKTEESD